MEELLCSEIIRFIVSHPGNKLPGSNSPYLDEALVGIASAADPIFQDYRQIIGPFHRVGRIPRDGVHSDRYEVDPLIA